MYLEAVGRTLRAIREQEMDRILEVAELMADEIAEDKLIHVYGTGGPPSWEQKRCLCEAEVWCRLTLYGIRA